MIKRAVKNAKGLAKQVYYKRVAKKNNATADAIRHARKFDRAPSFSNRQVTEAGKARANANFLKGGFLRRTAKMAKKNAKRK